MSTSRRKARDTGSSDTTLTEVDPNTINQAGKRSRSPIPRKLRQRTQIQRPARYESLNFLDVVRRPRKTREDLSESSDGESDNDVVDDDEEGKEEEDDDDDEASDGVEALRRRNMEDNRRFLAAWRNERGEKFPHAKKKKPKPNVPKPPPPPRSVGTRRTKIPDGAE